MSYFNPQYPKPKDQPEPETPPAESPPPPHKFGQFVVPENAHIKGLGGVIESEVRRWR